jgi:RNA polymerase sigma factor (sigma-70 family)
MSYKSKKTVESQRLTDEERDLVDSNRGLAVAIARRAAFKGDLNDAVQNAVLGMMDATKRFDSSRGAKYKSFVSPSAFWAVVSARRDDDFIRMGKNWKSGDVPRKEQDVGTHPDQVVDDAARQEWHEQFYIALGRLNRQHQEIVRLRVAGFTQQEIATELDIPVNRVCQTVTRLLWEIAKTMGPSFIPELRKASA